MIDRINVPVLGTAKRVLNEFQETGNYGSQSDALSDLLLNYRKLEERVKEQEVELAKLKEQLI